MGLEIAALRYQVSVLKRKNAQPRLGRWDRVLWGFSAPAASSELARSRQ
jgi:hypothetical protein